MNNGSPMKLKLSQMFLHVRRNLFFALPLFALLLAGCATNDNKGVYDQPDRDSQGSDQVPRLHIGDSVIISFDGPPGGLPMHEEIIKEDKTVTLPNIGHVTAAGLTSGELQDAIHDKYVPTIYTRLTVTVKPGDRVFFVRGDVKAPGRQIYTGPITLTKSITAAGDFTDFSNRKNVVLTRANGKRFIVDCVAILDGKKPDPGIFPGDQIDVKKKRF
jgi:protein involved in polysaccharide export with SLBB domain